MKKFKVKDLKEELKKLPEDADILIKMRDGCCGDYSFLDIEEIDGYSYKDINVLEIVVEALPGYETCISSGRMNKTASEIIKERESRNNNYLASTLNAIQDTAHEEKKSKKTFKIKRGKK